MLDRARMRPLLPAARVVAPVVTAPLLLALSCSSAPAGTPAGDAAGEGGDASLDVVESGAACVFNRDCPDGQRCDCSSAGCRCAVGARGTGKAGIDACSSPLDCASGLCVEGTAGSVCSGPCDEGCGDKLARCVDVATIGRICARALPTGATGAFGGRTFTFDHAYFGWDLGDAGPVATTLELHAGSDGACPPPKKDPQGTIVVAGLPGLLAAKSYPGLTATLLGFDAALPVKSSAKTVSVALAALESCPSPSTGTCGFDTTVDLSFAEGTVAGRVHAVHCPSMDVK